jgi:hypothetical protein
LELSGSTILERWHAYRGTAVESPDVLKEIFRQIREAEELTQNLAEGTRFLAPKEGYFDVFIHGAPDAVSYVSGKLGARELADWIVLHPEYTGQKIRLISCHTGLRDNGFAKQLAKELGVVVEAPTGRISFPAPGQVEIMERYIPGRVREFLP